MADWYVYVLHKGNLSTDLNNLRDITLLSNFGKIFDIVMINRLHVWGKERLIVYNTQADFHKMVCTCNNMCITNVFL